MKKLNFTSVVFLVLSLISSTFAWFAFNNIVNHDMNIDIKAWKVDISEGDSVITNKVDINLDSFHPGIDDVSKTVTIANEGDISANVSYKINYLRILDKEYDISDQDLLLDQLAQDYPFTINFSLGKTYLEVSDETQFTYYVSWPLDSGDDGLDAKWGNEAYDFIIEETKKHNQDNSYAIRDCISVEVELVVEQFVGEDGDKPDEAFTFGSYKYLTASGADCEMGDSGCYKFYVIEKENIVSDKEVLMMADPSQYFTSGTYDSGIYIDSSIIFNLISQDLSNTKIKREGLSDRALGYNSTYDSDDALYDMLEDGYVEFSSLEFSVLNSGECYWISDPNVDNLAIKHLEGNKAKVYYENSTTCKVVPFMEYTK